MQTFANVLIVLSILAIPLSLAVVVRFWDSGGVRGRMHNNQSDLLEDLKEADIHRLAIENASDGLLIQDMRGHVLWCNPAYCSIHGYSFAEIVGRNPLEFVLPPARTPSAKTIANFRYDPHDVSHTKLSVHENQHKDGHLFWNQLNLSFKTLPDGREYVIMVCRDITGQVEQTQELRRARELLTIQANHDSLTGVSNRAAFLSFFENAFEKRGGDHVGLLHIDLDKFKAVNDTHGHSAGDAVLVHTAASLSNHIREGDIVARVGGDEFVVVCPGIQSLEALGQLAEDMSAAICKPFEWTNCIIQTGASIGAVISSDASRDTEDLLVQADFALYEAKRNGRNQVAQYDTAMHERHARVLRRSTELADAVDTGNIDYYFQPKMDLSTRTVTGFETLARWHHPTEGMVPPDQFLPLAKELGLMGSLDLLSMTAALEQKARLTKAGYRDMRFAFNASPELLAHPDFINRLVWGVEAGGIDRRDIIVEVLETTDFGDTMDKNSYAAIIRDLHHAGFEVYLDDFGIGFAGLSHLAKLDVTGVKIDRSLIKEILTDPTSEKIVRKIVELGLDLGLTVIAEGVEDARTADCLTEMGCSTVQGFWLSAPIPSGDLEGWLACHLNENQARRA